MRKFQTSFLVYFPVVIAFVLYLTTAAKDITLIDSGELAMAAQTLGVAHPPGVPAYVLRGNFFIKTFFWLNPLQSMVLLSLVSTIVAVSCFAHILSRQVLSKNIENSLVFRLSAAFATVCFASGATIWRYATNIEIYALCYAFILISTLLAFELSTQTSHRKALIFGFVCSLGICLHPAAFGSICPALLFLFLWNPQNRSPMSFLSPILGALVGALILAYLPIAASFHPLLNWGKPDNWNRFLDHIVGRGYWGNFNATDKRKKFAAIEFSLGILRGELGLPLTAVACLGLTSLRKVDKRSFIFVLLLIIPAIAVFLSYDILSDKDAYFIGPFLGLSLSIPFVFSRIASSQTLAKTWLAFFCVSLLFLGSSLYERYTLRNVSSFHLPREHAKNILSLLPKNSLFISDSWFLSSTLLYMQNVEHFREDVFLYDEPQLLWPGFDDYFVRRLPTFAIQCEKPIRTFSAVLSENWKPVDDAAEAFNHYKLKIAVRQCLSNAYQPHGGAYQDILQKQESELSGFKVASWGFLERLVPADFEPIDSRHSLPKFENFAADVERMDEWNAEDLRAWYRLAFSRLKDRLVTRICG